MLSRIADSLFWLNRYLERADSLLRVIRTNHILSFDVVDSSDFHWRDILATFTTLDRRNNQIEWRKYGVSFAIPDRRLKKFERSESVVCSGKRKCKRRPG